MRSPLIEDIAPTLVRRGATIPHHATLAPPLGRVRGASAQSVATNIDPDAELALRAFRRQVWLVCRSAPAHIGSLGETAGDLYLRALGAGVARSSMGPWSDFVRAVWLLISELDCYPSQASHRWRDARGALSRIVVDNIDLLEHRTPAPK